MVLHFLQHMKRKTLEKRYNLYRDLFSEPFRNIGTENGFQNDPTKEGENVNKAKNNTNASFL